MLVLAAALPSGASAATFNVGSTSDAALRGAVRSANSSPGADTVKLAAGDYRLTGGQLVVTDSLTLRGAGARRTTIDPSPSPGGNRALDIRPSGPVAVTVAGVKITGGDLVNADGGAIFLEHAGSTLNLSKVAIYTNEAFNGGGVRADGTLNVSQSTFFANHTLGGAQGDGAAIVYHGAGRGLVVNSTFVANHGPDRGGAIDFSPSVGATLSILNSTIADNHADRRGGGVAAGGRGAVSLKNTIVARNTVNSGGKGSNCFGAVRSAGHNIEGGGRTCRLHARGDRHGELALGRTRNNGGPTDTRELLRRSPARNHARGCPSRDQRGHRRGRRCDIGAFEWPR